MHEPGAIVIIGGGHAGAQLCAGLVAAGLGPRVQLVCEEAQLPYQRPPLSKKFLLGEMSEEQLWLQGDGFFAQNAIDFMAGLRVVSLDPRGKRVRLDSPRVVQDGRVPAPVRAILNALDVTDYVVARPSASK